MGLLFHTSDPETHEMTGGTGCKAIYLSSDKAWSYFKEIYNSSDSDFLSSETNEVGEAWLKASIEDGIKEELRHFDIIRRSAVGRLLYIWNPFLRAGFSSHNHTLTLSSQVHAKLIYKEALRFFWREIDFYECSAPIIESAFSIEENETHKDDVHYLSSLSLGHDFLIQRRSNPLIFDSKLHKFNSQALANIIDDAFTPRGGLTTNLCYRYEAADKKSSLTRLIIKNLPLKPFLISPNAWPALLMANPFKLPVFRHVKDLVFQQDFGKSLEKSCTVPALWSVHGIINSLTTSPEVKIPSSIEKRFTTPSSKILSDLLWYILSWMAYIPVFKQKGSTEKEIFQYLERAWKFYLEGLIFEERNVWQEINSLLLKIDLIIVQHGYKIPEAYHATFALSAAQVVFDTITSELKELSQPDLALFGAAINKRYLQV